MVVMLGESLEKRDNMVLVMMMIVKRERKERKEMYILLCQQNAYNCMKMDRRSFKGFSQ